MDSHSLTGASNTRFSCQFNKSIWQGRFDSAPPSIRSAAQGAQADQCWFHRLPEHRQKLRDKRSA